MTRQDDFAGPPPPELELAKNWPGLDGTDEGSGSGPELNHTRIRQIFQALRDDLQALQGKSPGSMSATWSGPGTLGEVSGLGNVGPSDTGKWQVADYYGQSVEQGYTVLSGKQQMLFDGCEALITALEKAVTNYEKGHDASSA
ncbi:hypothetical protein [Streptosporangium sp. NPDC000396]|uniref:hypothetical protein n=1 Tax=Streptosporangium sp. NPDC000396 TaxID=3366185 RepID=UPI0036C1F855